MDLSQRIIVVARTHRHAMEWLMGHGYNNRQAIIVTDGELDDKKIYGLPPGMRYIRTSEPIAWGSRIYDALRAIGAEEIR